MKRLAAISLILFAVPAGAAELSSEYTKLDHQTDCHVIGKSDGEGDWADLVCPGYGNYPYFIRSGDGRETVTYGFATDSGMPSFGPFNYSNGTVEWRLAAENGAKRPLAAIQRWYIADPEGNWTTQILVVSKVGQPDGGGACVMGYVTAADGAAANERARALSDRAADFECGDEISVEAPLRDLVPRQ